jgi:glycosyltransferase involved in cell wall biosynthesis
MKSSPRPAIALWHNLPSGGGKRALMEQVKRLAKEVDIDLFTTTLVDDSFCPIEPYCRSVVRYPVSPNPFKMWKRIKRRWQQADEIYALSKKVAKVMMEGSYDAYYISPCQIEHTPSLLRFLQGKKIYYCQEGLREYYEPQPSLEGLKDVVGRLLKQPELIRRMWRDKRAMRSGAKILVNSQNTQRIIQRWYGVKTTVCYPGVDTEVFFPPTKKPTNRNTFLSVGRLNQLKGHDFVIQVIANLPEAYRVLTIVHDQEGSAERSRLEALAKELKVTVHFAHRVSEKELRELYQTCWAVICGQKREPFGLIPLEAMACGALVCAVAEGGFLETVTDGVNGMLVPRDPQVAASQLEAMLPTADVIRDRATHAVQEKWNWETHCRQLLEYLLS